MIRVTSHTLLVLTTILLLAAPAVPLAAAQNAPPATESDARLHADGKGWRLDKAKGYSGT